jgi:uncharacterized membrane protein YhhN
MFDLSLNLNLCLEWSGALVGLIGASLLATHGRVAKYGWLCFLVANVIFIGWALRIDAYGLLAQQAGFTLTSMLGIFRSGLLPSIACRKHT